MKFLLFIVVSPTLSMGLGTQQGSMIISQG